MTQNIEKYYGVTIKLTEELEPERLDRLIQIAPDFLRFKGYDPDDYYLYCHQLLIKPFTPQHLKRVTPRWAEKEQLAVEERIKSMKIIFTVNDKQLPTDTHEARIMFYNWRWDREDSIEKILGYNINGPIKQYLEQYEMDYLLDNNFIRTNNCFKNAILTVIAKHLRKEHRKIKAHVTAEPTEKFRNTFHNQANIVRETALDYYLNKQIMLNFGHDPTPRKIKIFLASSSELLADRDAFEQYFLQQNNYFRKDGFYLEIIRWENLLAAMADPRLQNEYNKAIRDCDIFVSLFFNKMGKYTEEEFDVAYQQFLSAKKPLIYTFFKNESVANIENEVDSLKAFKDKLTSLGHFPTNYKNCQDLKLQFNDQLKILLDKGMMS